ncbi:uncharacterized protein LOC132266565 [Cornus florida]|uniref:uncharacterized protein LOC132266565 n=1 Tax=Cornus florida TaxID=4283 RepID=UPI0028962F7A|nr:uncharacterized protein LOC132266565 [Cornus florida]XP_059623453.1 uncharacterized protein LOC132266565 [Cornus florida]
MLVLNTMVEYEVMIAHLKIANQQLVAKSALKDVTIQKLEVGSEMFLNFTEEEIPATAPAMGQDTGLGFSLDDLDDGLGVGVGFNLDNLDDDVANGTGASGENPAAARGENQEQGDGEVPRA